MIIKLLTTIFSLLLFTPIIFAVSSFPDVPEYHEYANEINFVENKGIVNGYSDGYFRPDIGVTRGELTKIVVNSKYSQETIDNCIKGTAKIFPDVTVNHDFAKYICQVKKDAVVKGFSDGRFRPDDFVTFGQAAKIILRALGSEINISEAADLSEYLVKLDEKSARPIRLLIAPDYEYINRGEVAFLIQIIMDGFVELPDEPPVPDIGYQEQKVDTGTGLYTVKYIAASLDSTRVLVDTASASDCADSCPVKSLSQYVSENNAYAGINGSYFCPVDAPSCAGKTNSFLVLVMNKNKVYFNSEHSIYSPDPVVVFGENDVRFIPAASDWGRDTSVNSVLSNYPLLVFDKLVTFTSDSDPKKESKSNRSFVANRGNIVYIGVVYNATVTESAQVLKTLNMDNAINLDAGGSTALWHEGYKAGPGRGLPNAILFVRK